MKQNLLNRGWVWVAALMMDIKLSTVLAIQGSQPAIAATLAGEKAILQKAHNEPCLNARIRNPHTGKWASLTAFYAPHETEKKGRL